MLKIRISGSFAELEQISQHMLNSEIKKFKTAQGKTTYAIDTQISVSDFLAQNDFAHELEHETRADTPANAQTEENKALAEQEKQPAQVSNTKDNELSQHLLSELEQVLELIDTKP